MRYKTLCFIIFVYTATFANAQSWQDTVALIDKVLSRYADANPGAQLAINRNGQIIYSSARGMADLEHNVPLTKTSKIEAGSVSKQFTAASILLLEQQGKLSMNDNVRKYVPEVPDYGYTITLQHLMNHTSGLKDWGSIADIAGWPRGSKAYANNDALQIISRQQNLNNKPGDEFIYSNSNYNLLAIIVDRASGTSLAEFSKKYLFEPAGMKNTEWRDNYQRVVPNRAIAYGKTGDTYFTNMPNENAYGNGGLLTTAEDLLIWNNYYLNGKLGTPSIFSKQIATTPFNNGKRNFYAAGLFVDSTNGWASITHSGATAGYRSNLDYFPQLGISIAWLSNTGQFDMGDIPSAVRNLIVKNIRVALPNTAPTLQIDNKNFFPYLGAYREAKTGNGMKVFMENNELFIQPHVKLNPLTANAVSLGRGRVEFKNAKPRLAWFINGTDTLIYSGVDSAQLSPQNLQDYTGSYTSNETESKGDVTEKEGKLFIKLRGNDAELKPVYKDGFSVLGFDLFFERDKKGKVSKMFISIPRARKVGFIKMK